LALREEEKGKKRKVDTMKKVILLVGCVLASIALSGCLGGGGGGGSSSSGGGVTVASLPDDGGDLGHNPEPVTLALFGGGLAAFAAMKRRKK